jgi:hypothetical protein
MGRAFLLGFVVVGTYAVIHWASPGLYWVEWAVLVAVIVGVGAVVAHAGGERPFLTATVASFMTELCIEYLSLFTGPAWALPEVLPPPVTTLLLMLPFSLMIAAMTGAVALGLCSLRARLHTGR